MLNESPYKIGLRPKILSRARLILGSLLLLLTVVTIAGVHQGVTSGDFDRVLLKPFREFAAGFEKATQPSPTPTPDIIWKDTALKGTLTKSNTTPVKFFLVTTSTEAVTLEVPVGFNLITLVGKRILAVGTYNSKDKVLEVEDIQDLEVLSTTPVPIPTSPPTPTPTPSPSPTPTPTAIPTIEPTSTPVESSPTPIT